MAALKRKAPTSVGLAGADARCVRYGGEHLNSAIAPTDYQRRWLRSRHDLPPSRAALIASLYFVGGVQ